MTLNRTTNLEQRQRNFNVWREDFEKRLALFLFNASKPRLSSPAAKRVEVVESEAVRGGWDVFFDGRKLYHFAGADAHRRATKAAASLANS